MSPLDNFMKEILYACTSVLRLAYLHLLHRSGKKVVHRQIHFGGPFVRMHNEESSGLPAVPRPLGNTQMKLPNPPSKQICFPDSVKQNIPSTREQISNLATLKYLEFNQAVALQVKYPLDFESLKEVVGEFFDSERGILKYRFEQGTEVNQCEVNASLIPRLFLTLVESGVCKTEPFSSVMQSSVLDSGCVYVESSRLSLKHWYSDGSNVTIYGTVKVMFNSQLKIEWMDFQTHHVVPGVEWPVIEQRLGFPHDGIDMRSQFKVFKSLSSSGLQESVMRFLQVGDVMGHLGTLMVDSVGKEKGPFQALSNFVKEGGCSQEGSASYDDESFSAADEDVDRTAKASIMFQKEESGP